MASVPLCNSSTLATLLECVFWSSLIGKESAHRLWGDSNASHSTVRVWQEWRREKKRKGLTKNKQTKSVASECTSVGNWWGNADASKIFIRISHWKLYSTSDWCECLIIIKLQEIYLLEPNTHVSSKISLSDCLKTSTGLHSTKCSLSGRYK